jgi:hypothetical protein
MDLQLKQIQILRDFRALKCREATGSEQAFLGTLPFNFFACQHNILPFPGIRLLHFQESGLDFI